MRCLKKVRMSKGMTQVALAKELGVSQSNVSMWESGVACPDAKMIEKIADVLYCTIDALYGREPPRAAG